MVKILQHHISVYMYLTTSTQPDMFLQSSCQSHTVQRQWNKIKPISPEYFNNPKLQKSQDSDIQHIRSCENLEDLFTVKYLYHHPRSQYILLKREDSNTCYAILRGSK